MRQIFLSIWMENKQLPILVICKVVLIVLSICIGFILNGFPYGIACFLLALPLQIFSLKSVSQIKFLIPVSDSAIKSFFLIKNLWIAAIYSTANILGYILMICFCGRYAWDGEMVLLILVMYVFSFYLFFWYRTVVVGKLSFEWADRAKFSLPKKENWWVVIESIMPLLGIAWMYLFLMYKLERIDMISFLGRGDWRIICIVVLAITIVLLCYTTWRRCENLIIGDYFG